MLAWAVPTDLGDEAILTMPRNELLPDLRMLLARLYDETAGFLERSDDLQAWYNRGYANGMIEGFRERDLRAELPEGVELDAPDIIAGHEMLPWGRAYRHGWETGRREALEVLE